MTTSGSKGSGVADERNGVVAITTSIGEVRGEEGFYHYRHYSAIDLAESFSLEQVWYLLVNGELPTSSALDEFTASLRPLRDLPNGLTELLEHIVSSSARPIDALRSTVSMAASACDLRPVLYLDRNELRTDGLRLCAMMPALVAACHRLRQGLEPIASSDELGHAANALFMLTGEVPDEQISRAFEQYLITTIDHGLNASTYTARVIASTGADMGSAVVGAIGALSGPLHGGAPARVLDMLDELSELGPESVDDWVRQALEDKRRIMGFGHRLYRSEDPRAVFMRNVAQDLSGERIAHAVDVERQISAALARHRPGHRLNTNVEYYAGVVMERCGIDRDLFTSMFACARAIGWCAHIVEQVETGRPIRPSATYIGDEPHRPPTIGVGSSTGL